MSKISLEPNASGAGTFTLAAPNSNTNRTLNLPDEDGKLLVQDTSNNVTISDGGNQISVLPSSGQLIVEGGNDFVFDVKDGGDYRFEINNSEAVRIDSSGNVGIGRSSPAVKLDVQGSVLSRNNTDILLNDINAINNDPNRWNDPANSSLKLNNVNQSLSIIVGGEGNDRRAMIQVGHRDPGFAQFLGELWLNKLGGTVRTGGNLVVNGALSKNSGSFKIDHPLPEKSETHHLVHSFVESPLADNIYRGVATLTDGTAQVNIDSYTGMTEGTFSALNGNPQIFLQNESGFEPVKGHVTDNILYIQCRDETSTDTISWMVVAERQDQHMLDTEWTDEFGRPVLEPEKNPEPDEELDSDGEVI